VGSLLADRVGANTRNRNISPHLAGKICRMLKFLASLPRQCSARGPHRNALQYEPLARFTLLFLGSPTAVVHTLPFLQPPPRCFWVVPPIRYDSRSPSLRPSRTHVAPRMIAPQSSPAHPIAAAPLPGAGGMAGDTDTPSEGYRAPSAVIWSVRCRRGVRDALDGSPAADAVRGMLAQLLPPRPDAPLPRLPRRPLPYVGAEHGTESPLDSLRRR
jgi:hypothetical protein